MNFSDPSCLFVMLQVQSQGYTACPLTSAHRFNTLMVLGKYARVWHRPYLNRANNLAYVLGQSAILG